MKYPNIFHNKFIAIIAGILAVGYFVGKPSLMDILFGVAWLLGAVFTWKKQIWAAMLLTILAIYNLIFDIILEIPNFKVTVNEMSADIEIAKSLTLTIAISVIAFETFVLLCVIYYGIIVLRRK